MNQKNLLEILCLLTLISCTNSKSVKQYYSTGELMTLTSCDDSANCKKTFYHKNGEIEVTMNVEDGKVEGEVKEYYSTGELRTRFNYINGNREGLVEHFYKDQTLKFINLYSGDSLFYKKGFPRDLEGYKDEIVPIVISSKDDGADSLELIIKIPFIENFPFVGDELVVNYEILKSGENGQDLPPNQIVFSGKKDYYKIKMEKGVGLDLFGLIKSRSSDFEHYFRKSIM